MTVRIQKPAFNIREKLSELERPIGLKGSELMRAETAQEVRDFVSAGRKNLIINGAMQVAQRGTSASSITASGYYTIDRFQVVLNTLGTWTMDQSTDAPSTFSHSLRLTCTTADPSPGPSDYNIIYYRVESQDLIQLGYGTSLAKDLTISFWVKTNKTGKASFTLRQTDNSSKLYSVPYSINSQDTWEYKTITIPGDTAGLFDKDSGEGLVIQWWLNSGSAYTTGSHGGWKTADESSRNVSNLRVGGATSDYFQITGVQLEVGKNATEFEHRSYGEELALCQRYFEVVFTNTGYVNTCLIGKAISANQALFAFPWKVEKRAAPTTAITGTGTLYYGLLTTTSYTFGNFDNGTIGGRFTLNSISGSPLTAGEALHFDLNSSPPFVMTVSAEL